MNIIIQTNELKLDRPMVHLNNYQFQISNLSPLNFFYDALLKISLLKIYNTSSSVNNLKTKTFHNMQNVCFILHFGLENNGQTHE